MERAHASRDVILCGGVIDSPKLLLLSGIGPASHLRALGIPVVADLPGVGANLQDHLRISVRWQGRQTLPPSTTTAGLFVRTARAGATETPDLHFYLGRGTDQPDPMVTITVALGRPHSRGEVRLSSTNPLDPPIIRAHYLRVPADVAALTAGVKLIRTLGNSRPFQPLVSGESEPGSDVRTDDEIASFIRRGADTIFHAAASCPMGTDRMAVVDSSLRVHGLEGVRVADASIMPNVVNAPTHAACIMIGERLADLCRT
jgi:choline dehydrogenase